MALATRCPNCHALFRVAADQLKLRGGLVRCGACQHVFDAINTLNYVDDASLSTTTQATAATVGSVIAAIRKAESAAAGEISTHGVAVLPPAPAAAGAIGNAQSPGEAPTAATGGPGEETAVALDEDEAAPVGEAPVPAFGAEAAAIDVSGAARAAFAPGADEPPPESTATEQRTDSPVPSATPTFLREPWQPRKRASTMLLRVGAVLLAALVLAQLAVTFRTEILMQFPNSRPALGQLCRIFRCTVSWPARGDLLAVVGSELQALPGTGAFELIAIVRNRGSMTLALPAIELTLSDTLNRTVARKVFAPADYLGGETDPRVQLLAGLEPGADLTVRIAFEARGVNAAGFTVYPFYL